MNATGKVKLLKLVVVLALAIWMLLPEISIVTEGGDGLEFSIGSESVFEVGDTTEDAIRANLDSSVDAGAVQVSFGDVSMPIDGGGTEAAAAAIASSGASEYRAVDASGSTVTVRVVDMSTESAQRAAVRIESTERFINSLSPSMSVGFALGHSEVSIPTDSRIETDGGTMVVVIDIQKGLYDVARSLGCELVVGIDVRYLGMLEASVQAGFDDDGFEDAAVSVSGSVCTISFDPSAEDLASAAERLDGASVCGSVISSSVSPGSSSISFDIGASGSLSGFLEDSLGKAGTLSLAVGGRTLTLDGGAAEGVIDIAGILEASA